MLACNACLNTERPESNEGPKHSGSLVNGHSRTLGSHGSLGFVKWSRRLTWLLSSRRHSVIQLDPDGHRTVWEADNPVENVY